MSNDRRQNSPESLGTRPVKELLVQYSVPAIIASVATSLYNIVDSIFIGQGVGPMALAGLAITLPLMNLVIAFCTLIAVGGATIISIFLGQQDYKCATDGVNNVTLLCFIHSIIFGGITLIFLDEILLFFGATAETLPYAHEFMEVILYGTPISYVFLGLNNLMRATGYPKKAMISALFTVVVNIALAPIFIFSCEWGIKGAAIATIMGQVAGLIWVLSHFISTKSYVHFDLKQRWFTPHIFSKMYAIGLSPFLMNVCACIVVIFLNNALLAHGGDQGNMAIGAYGILNRTGMFFVMLVFGVTQGMQPILGYNYGAGQWYRVKKTLSLGIWFGVGFTSIGWVITEFFPEWVSMLFTSDEQLIELSSSGSRIFFLFFPLVGAQIIIQNFFQSIGMPKLSIFLSLTRQLIFLIPFLVILPSYYGINGVWSSMAASDLLAFALGIITIIIISRKLDKQYANNSNIPSPTQN